MAAVDQATGPERLVLAGQAGCLPRGRSWSGLGDGSTDAVLRRGLSDDGRGALVDRGPGGKPLDVRPPRRHARRLGRCPAVRRRVRSVYRHRRLGGGPGRAGGRGGRRGSRGPRGAGAGGDCRASVTGRFRSALAQHHRDAVGHGGNRLPAARTRPPISRSGGHRAGRAGGRLAHRRSRGRPVGHPLVHGPGVRGPPPRPADPVPQLRARNRRYRVLSRPPGAGHRSAAFSRRQPGGRRVAHDDDPHRR